MGEWGKVCTLTPTQPRMRSHDQYPRRWGKSSAWSMKRSMEYEYPALPHFPPPSPHRHTSVLPPRYLRIPNPLRQVTEVFATHARTHARTAAQGATSWMPLLPPRTATATATSTSINLHVDVPQVYVYITIRRVKRKMRMRVLSYLGEEQGRRGGEAGRRIIIQYDTRRYHRWGRGEQAGEPSRMPEGAVAAATDIPGTGTGRSVTAASIPGTSRASTSGCIIAISM